MVFIMKEENGGVKEEYLSLHEKMRSLYLIIALIVIGFPCIIFALHIGTQSPWFVIPLTIGVTCIVSLTTVLIESILRRGNIKLTESYFSNLKERSEVLISELGRSIEQRARDTEEKMDGINSKLELAGKVDVSGIIDIFPDRWETENGYHGEIRKHLSEYAEQIGSGKFTGKEIRIMGIALRHFFQNETYKEELTKLKELGVKFRVLLLDAESEAALERSKIESPEIYEQGYLERLPDEEKENYNLFLDTAMFRDLYGVHEYVVSISPPWIENFDVKYYKNDPSYYLIIFPDKLIIENYHYGSVKECEIPSDRPTQFIGGRIPIFVYDSDCFTSKLISNHFEQIWRRSSITPEDRDPFFRESIRQRGLQQERLKRATL